MAKKQPPTMNTAEGAAELAVPSPSSCGPFPAQYFNQPGYATTVRFPGSAQTIRRGGRTCTHAWQEVAHSAHIKDGERLCTLRCPDCGKSMIGHSTADAEPVWTTVVPPHRSKEDPPDEPGY